MIKVKILGETKLLPSGMTVRDILDEFGSGNPDCPCAVRVGDKLLKPDDIVDSDCEMELSEDEDAKLIQELKDKIGASSADFLDTYDSEFDFVTVSSDDYFSVSVDKHREDPPEVPSYNEAEETSLCEQPTGDLGFLDREVFETALLRKDRRHDTAEQKDSPDSGKTYQFPETADVPMISAIREKRE